MSQEFDSMKDGDFNSQGAKKSSSKTPMLDTFGRDLTQLASLKVLDPVFGRDAEIEKIVQILNKRKKNNPILIGEPGVGKTAVVEGLANAAEALCGMFRGENFGRGLVHVADPSTSAKT